MSEAELRARLALGDAPIVLTGRREAAAQEPRAAARTPSRRVENRRRCSWPRVSQPLHAAELESRAGARVRFLAWVDDRALDGLYRAATCFVLPSLAEGFGLPVLEAMIRGTPVACSDIPVLPRSPATRRSTSTRSTRARSPTRSSAPLPMTHSVAKSAPSAPSEHDRSAGALRQRRRSPVTSAQPGREGEDFECAVVDCEPSRWPVTVEKRPAQTRRSSDRLSMRF